MLDSVLQNRNQKDTAWLMAQKHLSKILGVFLNYLILATVFVSPLLIFGFGYESEVIRQFVFIFFVGLSWFVWLIRILVRKSFVWQKNKLDGILLVLFGIILLNSIFVGNIYTSWGIGGSIDGLTSLSWLTFILFLALLAQNFLTEKKQIIKTIFAYLLSSVLLVVFLIVWWIFTGNLISVFGDALATTVFWFAINVLLLVNLSSYFTGKLKIFFYFGITVHLFLMFLYDYDLGWYILIFGQLIWMVLQIIFENKITKKNLILPLQVLLVSVLFLFLPIGIISDSLGSKNSNNKAKIFIPTNLGWQRFFSATDFKTKILGSGIGQGVDGFWYTAELIDMRQISQFPVFKNVFLALLWEFGLFVFLFLLYFFLKYFWLLFGFINKKIIKNPAIQLSATEEISFVVYPVVLTVFVFLWFQPLAFVGVLSLILLMSWAFCGSAGSNTFKNIEQNQIVLNLGGNKSATSFWRFVVLIFFLVMFAYIFFVVRLVNLRAQYLQSITYTKNGAEVSIETLNNIIKNNNYLLFYRLARFNFLSESLIQSINEGTEEKQVINNQLSLLEQDLDYLIEKNANPKYIWQMAWQTEKIAKNLSLLPEFSQDTSVKWLKISNNLYETAVKNINRNVVLFTQSSSFWRNNAPNLAGDSGVSAVYYKKANDIIDKALELESSYQEAYLEKVELLEIEKRYSEAIELILPLINDNPIIAHRAGQLSFKNQKFVDAKNYFELALKQLPSFLQARYDLIQTYIALGDDTSAEKELALLEQSAPKDDIQIRAVINSLKELLDN